MTLNSAAILQLQQLHRSESSSGRTPEGLDYHQQRLLAGIIGGLPAELSVRNLRDLRKRPPLGWGGLAGSAGRGLAVSFPC